jgi:SAM-dependent methyltransferase
MNLVNSEGPECSKYLLSSHINFSLIHVRYFPGLSPDHAVLLRPAARKPRPVHEYGPDFYRFLASFALRSARRVIPKLTAAVAVRSVVDFGCGQGAWLSAWGDTGASVAGVDGPYTDRSHLLIDPGDFHAADLTAPIDLGRQFDLVQSLEVAEHLPAANAEQFVKTLTAHGPRILFSAAVPGQGGENHVNEQPPDYWRALFRERGYAAFDYLRPLVFEDPAIARWYRFNTIFYIRDDIVAHLAEPIRRSRVPDWRALDDYWPVAFRLRNAVVRRLPTGLVNRVSRINAVWAARRAAA